MYESIVQSYGQCTRQVKAGWSGCRGVSGVICDKVYKIVMRPAMMYGQCHCLLTKRQEAKVEV